MNIGKNIKTMRINRHITQGELAERLNVTNKAISSWECGRTEPNMGMIEAMCKVFECTKTELIDGISPNLPTGDTDDELIQKIRMLSPEQRKDVTNYIDFILTRK